MTTSTTLSDPHAIAHAVIAAIKSRDDRIERMAAAMQRADAAITALHRAFGAPGDYGYGTPKGEALYGLYVAQVEIHAARAGDEVEA